MDNGFTFGNRSTADFPIMKVEKYPASYGAKKKMESFSIPGRNGNLHIFDHAFENYTQPYECYFHTDKMTNETAHAVKKWLLRSAGYQRLTDAYDPDHYRLATVLQELKIDNILNRYGRFTVEFDCDPRAFLISGETPVSFAAAGTLENPTEYEAKPMITVTGTGTGSVSINGTTVEILAIDGSIILDCENENAHSLEAGAPVNENANVKADYYPVLSPGENSVFFDGGITGLEIVPRWWEL